MMQVSHTGHLFGNFISTAAILPFLIGTASATKNHPTTRK
jgi:hypothetical protein